MTEPQESDARQESGILQGDASERLSDVPASSCDLLLTSVPYWGLRNYTDDNREIGQERDLDDYLDALLSVFDAAERVLTDSAVVLVNLGDCYAGSGRGAWDADDVKESYSPGVGELPERNEPVRRKSQMGVPERLDLRLLDRQDWIRRRRCTWRKTNPVPDGADDRPQRASEPVFMYSLSPDHYWDEGRPPLPEVFDYPTSGQESDHPATMPMELCEDLIRYACPPGGRVLDPFAGVGTVLKAARNTGRDAIGIELDPDFAGAARRRIEKTDHTIQEAATHD